MSPILANDALKLITVSPALNSSAATLPVASWNESASKCTLHLLAATFTVPFIFNVLEYTANPTDIHTTIANNVNNNIV